MSIPRYIIDLIINLKIHFNSPCVNRIYLFLISSQKSHIIIILLCARSTCRWRLSNESVFMRGDVFEHIFDANDVFQMNVYLLKAMSYEWMRLWQTMFSEWSYICWRRYFSNVCAFIACDVFQMYVYLLLVISSQWMCRNCRLCVSPERDFFQKNVHLLKDVSFKWMCI